MAPHNTTGKNETALANLSSWSDFERLHEKIWEEFEKGFGESNMSLFPRTLGSSRSSDVTVSNEKDRFMVTFCSKDFLPDELKVSTFGNVLKVEGKHIDEEDIPGKTKKFASKQFSRSYTLPSDCQVGKMTSNFSNGKLNIEVPKYQCATIEDGTTRDIPIQVVERAKGNIRTVPINRNSESKKQNIAKESQTNDIEDFWSLGRRGSLFKNDWIRPVQLLNHDDVFENFFGESSPDFSKRWQQMSENPKGELAVTNEVQTQESEDRFEFFFDIKDYQPEKLKVSVLDDVLKVEGKHEDGDGRGGKTLSRHFVRSYVLPRTVYKMDEVESRLTRSGKLVVTVPKIQFKNRNIEKNIPIKTATF